MDLPYLGLQKKWALTKGIKVDHFLFVVYPYVVLHEKKKKKPYLMFNYYLANKEKVLLLFYFILETKVSLILSVNIRGPLFGLSRIVK